MQKSAREVEFGIDLGGVLSAVSAGPLIEKLVDVEVIAVGKIEPGGLNRGIGAVVVSNVQHLARGICTGVENDSASVDRADVITHLGVELDVIAVPLSTEGSLDRASAVLEGLHAAQCIRIRGRETFDKKRIC